jgi:hypothetical protein
VHAENAWDNKNKSFDGGKKKIWQKYPQKIPFNTKGVQITNGREWEILSIELR